MMLRASIVETPFVVARPIGVPQQDLARIVDANTPRELTLGEASCDRICSGDRP